MGKPSVHTRLKNTKHSLRKHLTDLMTGQTVDTRNKINIAIQVSQQLTNQMTNDWHTRNENT